MKQPPVFRCAKRAHPVALQSRSHGCPQSIATLADHENGPGKTCGATTGLARVSSIHIA